MAQNKITRFGPVVLSNTLTTNLLNPPTLTGGVNLPGTTVNCYYILRHIRITNVTSGAVTFTLCIGATGATASSSNAFMGFGSSVPANSSVDWYGLLSLDVADYLVGGAGAATSLTIEGELEIGVR